jgi:DNA replication protein DnaC
MTDLSTYPDFKTPLEAFRGQPASAEAGRNYDWTHCIAPGLRANGWEPRFVQRQELNKGQKSVLNTANNCLKNKGSIIALVGERGLGKTTLAAQIAIDRAEAFWNYYSVTPAEREGLRLPNGIPIYRKMAGLVKRFKSLYADFGSIETQTLVEAQERLCNETLLVIDELHECDELKIKDRVLTDLVDIRYSRNRDTILISNQTEADFRATVNDSVLSRLSEHGRLIVCKWASFRSKQ